MVYLLSSAADIRTIAPTCLHVGGVQGAIEDEAKLMEIFSRFGIVLAVTLRIRREGKKVSWALVSFSSVSEADSCLAGMGELAKRHPGLVARQVDEKQALLSKGAMSNVMSSHIESRVATLRVRGDIDQPNGKLDRICASRHVS